MNTPRFAADERVASPETQAKSTLMTQMDPELHCGPISMTQKNGNSPVLTAKVCVGMQRIAWNLLLGTTGCTGSCPTSVVGHESYGTVTRVAKRMSSTHLAPVVPSGVELVSRATYISRKKRNRETCWRQSKALKRVQREAERKLVAQPEISHEVAEAILRSQAARPACSDTWPRERVFLHTMPSTLVDH